MDLHANLEGKRALVTGASSGGLGRYFAKLLASSGAHVTVSARREAPLVQLTKDIVADGGSADHHTLDVSDYSAVQTAFRERDPYDIVVSNAGVDVAKPILDQTEEDYDYVMDINLKGVWNIGIEAARKMRDASVAGTIINIASITGLRQVGRITPYAVSKSGVIHLTKQMALELARFNIRVNAIAPGYFVSDMTREYMETEQGKAMVAKVPMKRLGDYQSLGGAILLLSSDASSFMTGSVLTVDGGHMVNSL